MSRHRRSESNFSGNEFSVEMSLLPKTKKTNHNDYGGAIEESSVVAITRSPQIFDERQKHFKTVQDLIATICEYLDPPSLCSYRFVNRQFNAVSLHSRAMAIATSFKLLKKLSTIPNYQENAIIAQPPNSRPRYIETSSLLAFVRLLNGKNMGNLKEMAIQFCSAQQSNISENTDTPVAFNLFKSLCDAVKTQLVVAVPENQAEAELVLQSNCPKICWPATLTFLFLGFGMSILMFGVYLASKMPELAPPSNSTASNSTESSYPVPVANTNFMLLAGAVFFTFLASFALFYCGKFSYLQTRRVFNEANGNIRDYLDRPLKFFSPTDAKMIGRVANFFQENTVHHAITVANENTTQQGTAL